MPNARADIGMFEAVAKQEPSLRWYAIADSAQHPELPDMISTKGYPVGCLLGGSQGSPLSQYAPHLVSLCSPLENTPVWNWISLQARAKPCVTILATHMQFEELFGRLVGFLDVALPDGEAMILAFWDPAILGTLMGQTDDETLHVKGPILSSSQRHMLVSGITGWWYWDRSSGFHEIPIDRNGNVRSLEPIELTQPQVDSLVEASVPDHLLYYLELNQPSLITDIPSSQRYGVVRRASERGRDIGLLTMRDLVNYVCIELVCKERMIEDEKIKGLMQQVKDGYLELDEAIASL
jgi:hypothetical protein